MVLPLPSLATPDFPSEYAMSYRNLFFGLSLGILLSALLQIFMMHNILGGFMTSAIGGIGFYVIRDKSVDVGCMMTWGMVAGRTTEAGWCAGPWWRVGCRRRG